MVSQQQHWSFLPLSIPQHSLVFVDLKNSCNQLADENWFVWLSLHRCTRGLRHWISQTTTFLPYTELIFTRVICSLFSEPQSWPPTHFLCNGLRCFICNCVPLFYFGPQHHPFYLPTSQKVVLFVLRISLEHCTVCTRRIRAQMRSFYWFLQFAVRVGCLTRMWSLMWKKVCLKTSRYILFVQCYLIQCDIFPI